MIAKEEYINVCEEAVRAGAAILQKMFGRVEVREKGPADLVTEADFASQEVIRKKVLGAFPGHSFLGEEDLQATGRGERAEYRWVADPLDGTTNYAHQVPHYSVSLALERCGEVLVGAVYDPVIDECFTAAAGAGAFLNGRPIHTSAVSDLSGALAAVGFPPGTGPDTPDLKVFLAAVGRCQAIRRSGSSALNLCYVASGRFDVYWSFSTKIWDVAAGVLMVREAGGVITSPDGSPFVLERAHFLAAANQPLHSQLRELVAGAVA